MNKKKQQRWCTLPVDHENEVEDAVEERHCQINQTQIDQKIVGHRFHLPVSFNST